MCRFISEVQYYFQSLSVVIFTSKAYHEYSFLTIFNTTAHHAQQLQKDSCFFVHSTGPFRNGYVIKLRLRGVI